MFAVVTLLVVGEAEDKGVAAQEHEVTPRGGISIYLYANYGCPDTKYEQLAERRLLDHQLV